MEAYDALEHKVVKEMAYDEPTAEQKATKAARLEEVSLRPHEQETSRKYPNNLQLRNAVRILNDPGSRRKYDRELRGEAVNWWSLDESANRAAYRDFDRPSSRRSRCSSTTSLPWGAVRKHSTGRNASRRIDRYRSTVTYPDFWIAAVNGRDWPAPTPRSSSPYQRPPRPRSRSRSLRNKSLGRRVARVPRTTHTRTVAEVGTRGND